MMEPLLRIHGTEGYPVYLGEHILGGLLPGILSASSRVFAVTDRNVFRHYETLLRSVLPKDSPLLVLEPGETLKSADNLCRLWETFAEAKLDRHSTVVAVGGGTVGDLVGFAAATYMRGLDIVQVPTTLLSMTDSAIGGKTAIDIEAGKNLVGTFHRPKAVIADTAFLATLPPEDLRSGMGEVIKYSFITENALPELLKSDKSPLCGIIAECIRAKAALAEADEFDRGPRMALNFGHTVGHAAEALSGFAVPHGFCVVWGCLCVLRGCAKRGLCEASLYGEFEGLAEKYSVIPDFRFSAEEIAARISADKKSNGNTVTFVYPPTRGKAAYLQISQEELPAFLTDCLTK